MIDGTTVYGVSVKHKNMLTDSDGMHLKMDSHRFGDFLPTVDDFRDPEIKKNFETADVFNDKGHEENVAGDTRVLENATLTRYALNLLIYESRRSGTAGYISRSKIGRTVHFRPITSIFTLHSPP